ncbi:MAG: glutathione peroxidase [Melioribacteraceae bacterium]|nr:glutathione peroxidase [Melioribacteraceae bacterium]MCF8265148.1 glutathione peroxidase [Melioribacteraceae bacterium]
MEGNSIKLSDYEGKVLLIVNVASKCGFTPQYEGLQTLYDTYKSQGFEILAFPCNDFKGQEPGTNDEILDFCSSNYGVTFKLFDKIKVLGEDKEPLYKLLTNSTAVETGDIGWNFEKFLISKDGEILKRFGSSTEPLSAEILKEVESALKS